MLEVDPEIVDVEGVDVLFRNPDTGEIENRIVRPDSFRRSTGIQECFDDDGDGRDDRCIQFSPRVFQFIDLGRPRYVYLNMLTQSGSEHWPGREFHEVFALLVRVREDASVLETPIRPGRLSYTEGLHVITVESGAIQTIAEGGCGVWEPAEVEGGRIVLEPSMIRGDANTDGQINITDAIKVLSFLFNSVREPACLKAADADDDGALNITDPILLLGVLFGGEGALPAPSTCAPDPTDDTLGCEEGCSAG